MFGAIIGAIAGAVVGGVVRGVTAAETNKRKISAYKDAAKQVREATDKYSGKNAYQYMKNQGMDYASTYGQAVGNEVLGQSLSGAEGPGTTNAGAMQSAAPMATAASNVANKAANDAFNQGMQMAKNEMNAKYNAETTQAQQLMKQADIDYGVANQAAQEALNTAGNLANTYSQLRRTNNGRSYAGQQ